jgi:hypothetical protein
VKRERKRGLDENLVVEGTEDTICQREATSNSILSRFRFKPDRISLAGSDTVSSEFNVLIGENIPPT